MRTTEGQTWSVQSDLPYHVNFACWVKRRWGSTSPFPEEAWSQWVEALVEQNPIHDAAVVGLARDRELNDFAAREWYRFVREWGAAKPALARRLQQALNEAGFNDLMQGQSEAFTFWHTDHPGDLCLQVGSVWVLGDAYLEPEPLRALLTRLVGEAE
ncbi:MAG: hypothetical protein ACOY94_10260 [Bacillota bacterium]